MDETFNRQFGPWSNDPALSRTASTIPPNRNHIVNNTGHGLRSNAKEPRYGQMQQPGLSLPHRTPDHLENLQHTSHGNVRDRNILFNHQQRPTPPTAQNLPPNPFARVSHDAPENFVNDNIIFSLVQSFQTFANGFSGLYHGQESFDQYKSRFHATGYFNTPGSPHTSPHSHQLQGHPNPPTQFPTRRGQRSGGELQGPVAASWNHGSPDRSIIRTNTASGGDFLGEYGQPQGPSSTSLTQSLQEQGSGLPDFPSLPVVIDLTRDTISPPPVGQLAASAAPEATSKTKAAKSSTKASSKAKSQSKPVKKPRSTFSIDHIAPENPEWEDLTPEELLATITDPNDLCGNNIIIVARKHSNPVIHARLNELLKSKGKGPVTKQVVAHRIDSAFKKLFPTTWIDERNALISIRKANRVPCRAGPGGKVTQEWYDENTKKRLAGTRKKKVSKVAEEEEVGVQAHQDSIDEEAPSVASRRPGRANKKRSKRTADDVGLEDNDDTSASVSPPASARATSRMSTSKKVRLSNFPQGRTEEEIAAGVVREKCDEDVRFFFGTGKSQ